MPTQITREYSSRERPKENKKATPTHQMRFVLCCCCVLAFLLTISQALSIAVDCSLPENAPKCRPRTGTPKVPGSAPYINQIKDLVKAVDNFLGGDAMSSKFAASIDSELSERGFGSDIMSGQQQEIEFVMKDLLHISEQFVNRCFSLARQIRSNATALVNSSTQVRCTIHSFLGDPFSLKCSAKQHISRMHACLATKINSQNRVQHLF
jgi:hypothetical protein